MASFLPNKSPGVKTEAENKYTYSYFFVLYCFVLGQYSVYRFEMHLRIFQSEKFCQNEKICWESWKYYFCFIIILNFWRHLNMRYLVNLKGLCPPRLVSTSGDWRARAQWPAQSGPWSARPARAAPSHLPLSSLLSRLASSVRSRIRPELVTDSVNNQIVSIYIYLVL